MSTLVEELSARAKTLPAADRARLAEEILDSLQEDPDAATIKCVTNQTKHMA